MTDFPGARRLVADIRPLHPASGGNRVRQLQHRGRAARADIRHRGRRRRGRQRGAERGDNVGHVDEVAGLPAVTEDRHRVAAHQPVHEDRDHA